MNDSQNYILAAAQIISLYLGYENLIENRAQSAANDVNKANNEQADLLLKEINSRFAEQNQILDDISNKLSFLIDLYLQDHP